MQNPLVLSTALKTTHGVSICVDRKPCCLVILKETLSCVGADTPHLREQGGGFRAFAGRRRREISLNDSSIRDLT